MIQIELETLNFFLVLCFQVEWISSRWLLMKFEAKKTR